MRKFGRTYEIIIQLADGQQVQIKPPVSIDFKLTRNALASANNCILNIYNLADTTRAQLFRDRFDVTSYMPIQIKAGYGTADFVVFKGSIWEAGTVRQGTDWVTTIDAQDGFFDQSTAFTSTTVEAGTEKPDILKQVINDLPNVVLGVIGTVTGQAPERGQVLFGRTTEVIDELTEGKHFIDNERFFCLGDNEYLANEVLKLDGESLIGTPVRRDTQLEAKSLFYPQAVVKMLLEIENSIPAYNGQYQVLGFAHDFTWSGAVAGEASTMFTLDRGALLRGVS
jgi:hypothetical protein